MLPSATSKLIPRHRRLIPARILSPDEPLRPHHRLGDPLGRHRRAHRHGADLHPWLEAYPPHAPCAVPDVAARHIPRRHRRHIRRRRFAAGYLCRVAALHAYGAALCADDDRAAAHRPRRAGGADAPRTAAPRHPRSAPALHHAHPGPRRALTHPPARRLDRHECRLYWLAHSKGLRIRAGLRRLAQFRARLLLRDQPALLVAGNRALAVSAKLEPLDPAPLPAARRLREHRSLGVSLLLRTPAVSELRHDCAALWHERPQRSGRCRSLYVGAGIDDLPHSCDRHHHEPALASAAAPWEGSGCHRAPISLTAIGSKCGGYKGGPGYPPFPTMAS